MINKFISKLPFFDKLIFFSGKFFNKIGHWILTYKNFGFWQLHYNLLRLKNINVDSDGRELHYSIDGIQAYSRISSSDSLVFNLVLIEEEYKAATDIFLLNNLPLNSFLDLGSNIGLTSLYVKKIFHGAKVIALEPDKNNYSMMVRNFELNHLSNTSPELAGVGKKDCYLVVDGALRDKKDWAICFKEVDYPTDIKSYSISSLLKKYSLDEIDLIKIDVEGAEKLIFESDADISFLNKVKVLAIEIHNEFNTRDSIYKILRDNNFIVFNSRETTIAVKRNMFQ